MTATDGADRSEPAEASVTIQNTPPAAEVFIEPQSPTVQDGLTASVETDDPDGDDVDVSYQWKVDGEETLHEETSVSADATEKGEIWTVTVTPNDGQTDGNSASAMVEIGNSPPSITNLSLAPTTVYTDTTVTAEVETTDPDGDSLSLQYDWFVNSKSVSASGKTIEGSEHFEAGDNLQLELTVSDSSGATVTESVNTSIMTGWMMQWSHSLRSKPSGATAKNGAYKDQGPATRDGRDCWLQESDWNQLLIEYSDKIDSGRPFAVEAKFFREHPSTHVSHGIAVFQETGIGGGRADRLALLGAGAEKNKDKTGLLFLDRLNEDEVTSRVDRNIQTGDWTTWRIEVFPGERELKFYRNDEFLGKKTGREPLVRAPVMALFSNHNSVASSNICWADLKLYSQR